MWKLFELFYTSKCNFKTQKKRCGKQEITSFKTSNQSNLYWRKCFHKAKIVFKNYADFEVDNETDKSNLGDKTTNIFKHNPACNDYHIVSELNDVSQSGYYSFPIGFDNVVWFVSGK